MIATFTLRLIVGLSLTWCLLPRRLITSGFFRIQLLVTLGLSVLVTLTAPQWEQLVEAGGLTWVRVGAIAAAVVSFVGSVLWTLERRTAGTVACFLVTALAAATLLGPELAIQVSDAPLWLRWADTLSAGWLVGGLTGAMLLGHWYLTATGMQLIPLQRAVQWTQAATGLRLVIAVAGTMLAGEATRTALLDGHFVWTLLRWAAGLVGPLILAWMTPGALKYRNTQSATGMLFAAVILAFIGETAALLLRQELHWPL